MTSQTIIQLSLNFSKVRSWSFVRAEETKDSMIAIERRKSFFLYQEKNGSDFRNECLDVSKIPYGRVCDVSMRRRKGANTSPLARQIPAGNNYKKQERNTRNAEYGRRTKAFFSKFSF
jgi:hypothetical protein